MGWVIPLPDIFHARRRAVLYKLYTIIGVIMRFKDRNEYETYINGYRERLTNHTLTAEDKSFRKEQAKEFRVKKKCEILMYNYLSAES